MKKEAWVGPSLKKTFKKTTFDSQLNQVSDDVFQTYGQKIMATWIHFGPPILLKVTDQPAINLD